MDPHAALETIRQAIRYDGDLPDRLDIIAEHFTALDEWLTTGGFLPSEWQGRYPQHNRWPYRRES